MDRLSLSPKSFRLRSKNSTDDSPKDPVFRRKTWQSSRERVQFVYCGRSPVRIFINLYCFNYTKSLSAIRTINSYITIGTMLLLLELLRNIDVLKMRCRVNLGRTRCGFTSYYGLCIWILIEWLGCLIRCNLQWHRPFRRYFPWSSVWARTDSNTDMFAQWRRRMSSTNLCWQQRTFRNP